MKNNTWYIKVIRQLLCIFVLLFLYVLQSTPRLFTLWGIKPALVGVGAVCIAMNEGEFLGGIYGAFAGLLWDMSAGVLLGFHGMLLCLFGTAIGLMAVYLVQVHIGNVLLFSFSSIFITELILFVFSDWLFHVPQLGLLFLKEVLFLSIWSTVFALLLFFPMRAMSQFLKAKQSQNERRYQ